MNLKKSPAKRKSDAKEGVYFKKIKVVPKLKLSDATLQRDRMDNDGFADGEATLRITGVPDHFTVDRCPEYLTEDRKKKPCLRSVVRFLVLSCLLAQPVVATCRSSERDLRVLGGTALVVTGRTKRFQRCGTSKTCMLLMFMTR
jgi:hypothetical protein